MDFENALSFPPYPGEFLHPVVYACTSVLLLCMLASIITYVVHQRAIRISRHAWHMLLNLCLYTALTFTVFAGGINRITSPVACRAVGIVLHYCSLCSLLWLGVSARYIYIQVTKEIPQGPDGDPCSPQRPPPSILRCYLVSDGVPLLICVVTAATDMENYGSSDDSPFCWIAWEPSLGAFYGPVALIVLATCIYFLCASVQLRRHPERRYELQIVTEEQRRLSGTASGVGGPSDTPGATLANELSLRSQLRTAAFTLFLFLTTWAFGALAVWLGPVLDMVFSCLYGASCASLGLFLLIQHCAKREDVWQRWWACRSGPRPAPTPPKPSANGDVLGPGCDRPPSTYGRVASSSATQVGRCCMLSPGQKTAEGRAQAGSPPGQVLQSCLKDRTKHHPLSRYTYRVASSSLDGSAHSSYLESPQCTLEVHSCPSHDAYSCHGIRDTLPCSTVHDLEACHGINEGSTCHEGFVCCGTQERHMCDSMREGHGSKRTQEGPVYKCMPEGHVCPSVCEEHRCKCIHEEYTCKCACEEHICNSMHEGRDYQCHPAYPKADPFAIACQGDSEPGSAFYGCRKMANKETLLPLEKDSQNLANHIQPPAFPQTQASQNRSPNVRLKREAAGLWKNETSV